MAKKTKKPVVGSLQPDVDSMLDWNSLTLADFAPAGQQEKEDFIQQRKSVSYWADAWRRLRKNAVAMVALGVIILLVLYAFVGPMLIPYGYDEFNKGAENLYPWHYSLEAQEAYKEATQLQDPDEAIAQAKAEAEAKGEKFTSVDAAMIRAQIKTGGSHPEFEDMEEAEIYAALGYRSQLFGYSNDELQRIADGEKVFPHVFGTDRYGRDIMVRTMYATRVSMIIGLAAALIVLVIGAIYGSISGYCGGKVDAVMQRIVEIIYTIPEVLIILLLGATLKPILENFQNSGDGFLQNMVTILGPNLIAIFIAFGLLYWVTMSRIIRGQILQLKQQEYVTAARALGAKGGRIIKRHLLPNCVGQIVTTTFLQIPSAIFTESFLSFLGMGVSAPMTSLGSMCSDGLSGLQSYPYRLFIPAIILSILILCLNLFGDGLRDALDPRLKK